MVSFLTFFGYFCLFCGVSSTNEHPEVIEWNEKPAVPRLLKGLPSSDLEYPFYVMILKKYPDVGWKYLCGGSLLTDSATLTACHCITRGGNPYTVVVIAGVRNPWIGGVGRQSSVVDESYVHPSCGIKERNYPREFDVGIMVLRNSFIFTAYVKPLTLYSRDPDHNMVTLKVYASLNLSCFVVGNGMTGEGINASMSHYKEVGEVQVMSDEECRARTCMLGYETLCDYDFEEHGHMCLRATKAQACGSDSGGPIIISGKVFGVVSWSTECRLGYLFGGTHVRAITEVANWFLGPAVKNPNDEKQDDTGVQRKSTSFLISPFWIKYVLLSLIVLFRTR